MNTPPASRSSRRAKVPSLLAASALEGAGSALSAVPEQALRRAEQTLDLDGARAWSEPEIHHELAAHLDPAQLRAAWMEYRLLQAPEADLSQELDAALGVGERAKVFPEVREVLEALAATFPTGEGPRAPQELRPESFRVTPAMARAIHAEGKGQSEEILRIIEAEPMGIERLAELLGTKAGVLRPVIRTLESAGLLETHRDRLMLGPVHVVALPCSETAINLVLGAFTRHQISRHDVKKNTGLSDDSIRQAIATLTQRGVIRMKFIGALPIYELLVDQRHPLPHWATAHRSAARVPVHRPGTPQIQSRMPRYAQPAPITSSSN